MNRRLSKKERDQLQSLMEGRQSALSGPMRASISRLHGFLTSVVSGPLIMPSEWIPMVIGNGDDDGGWETLRQAKRAMTLLMCFYNEVVADLAGERSYGILLDRLGDPPDTIDLPDECAKGTASASPCARRSGARP